MVRREIEREPLYLTSPYLLFTCLFLTHLCTYSGFAFFTATPLTWLHADLATVYAATTANETQINHLAQKQEDLKQESKLELGMQETLQAEVPRLEECLAIDRREIKNIGVREEIRQFQLRELKDLGLVMLVQALRDETQEDEGVEERCGDKTLKRQTSGSNDQES